ncbi:MAG TPA: histidine phosphatase family protein, partial [Acidimicrobiales bacterium]|nr:histidine phosphatase family protein [Acidimicrobiales bacterium]
MIEGRLWLIRHGQTAWSRSGQHTGRTDLPLEPEGEEQARAVAGRLADTSFTLVLTSPLVRAIETCRLAGCGADAEVTADLAEWDYGDYEGRTTDDIRTGQPGWTLWTDGVPG